MFVFTEDKTFTAKVQVYEPGDCKKTVREFETTFRVLPPERVTALLAEAATARVRGETSSADAALLAEVTLGWKGIKTDSRDGEDFAFSEENLTRLIALPYVRTAMIDAYTAGVSGARSGN